MVIDLDGVHRRRLPSAPRGATADRRNESGRAHGRDAATQPVRSRPTPPQLERTEFGQASHPSCRMSSWRRGDHPPGTSSEKPFVAVVLLEARALLAGAGSGRGRRVSRRRPALRGGVPAAQPRSRRRAPPGAAAAARPPRPGRARRARTAAAATAALGHAPRGRAGAGGRHPEPRPQRITSRRGPPSHALTHRPHPPRAAARAPARPQCRSCDACVCRRRLIFYPPAQDRDEPRSARGVRGSNKTWEINRLTRHTVARR